MNNSRNYRRIALVAVITAFLAIIFLATLTVFALFLNESINTKALIKQLEKAHRISSLHGDIKFERAFSLLSDDRNFGVFELNCEPYFISDLLLNKSACRKKNKNFKWTTTSVAGNKLVLAQRHNFDPEKFIQENLNTLQITAIAFIVLSLVFTFIGYKVFVTIPSLLINQKIESVLSKKPIEQTTFWEEWNLIFGGFNKNINRLITEILNFKEKEVSLELSRQIVHDLKVPIAILLDQLSDPEINKSLMSSGINRIQQISNSLLNGESTTSIIDLSHIQTELTSLARAFKVNLSIDTRDGINSRFRTKISDQQLYRILSNLIKNSFEAKSTGVVITFEVTELNMRIVVSDNGQGMHQDLIKKISIGAFTTKQHGQGLGLSYAYNSLRKVGGFLTIKDKDKDKGCVVQLNVPMTLNPNLINRIILIDDDKYIAINWMKKAQNLNIPFIHYGSYKDFNDADPSIFDKNDHFFFDLDIKGESGLALAEKISTRYKYLYLSTGHSNVEIPPFILDSVGKQFPI